MKTLLFSLTSKDFIFQTFCTGGKGGQHRNAKQNGVRCIHPPSKAVGEHRDGRDQYRNKQEAFKKCAEHPLFKAWHRIEVARLSGETTRLEQVVSENVDKMMLYDDLKIEYFNPEKSNV